MDYLIEDLKDEGRVRFHINKEEFTETLSQKQRKKNEIFKIVLVVSFFWAYF